MDANKQKAVDLAIAQIQKNFGKGSIMKLGDREKLQVESISTGSIALDLALGVGGVPRGRITEIYGPESSGKTTICSHIIAEAQKAGGVAAFVDAEHAFDPTYAKNIGVDVDNLLISQPDTGEQALEIVETLVRSGALDVIVVDSVAALTPRAEIEGEMGDSHMGLHARLMSQALRKLAGTLNKTNTALVFTNQIRMKIGVMFGNPETTTGGQALKFYSSVRIDVRRKEKITEGDEVIGNHVKARVVKNKVAAPFRAAEFDIMYNEGVSHHGGLIDVGVDMDVVKKSGSWYSFGDEKIGQGKESAKDYLRSNPDIAKQIENLIRAKVSGVSPAEVIGQEADSQTESDSKSPEKSASGSEAKNENKPVSSSASSVPADKKEETNTLSDKSDASKTVVSRDVF